MKKKDVFVSTIKGIITGISLWINNISIGSMLFSASSYENVIKGYSNINKKNNKELWYVCIPIMIGICLGLLGGFDLISYFYKKYNLQTNMLFIGFFIGGIRTIAKSQKLHINKKNAFIPLIIITISMMLITLLESQTITIKNNLLNTLVIGIITGISVLIPSFTTLITNIKGGYSNVLNALKISSLNDILIILIFLLSFTLIIVIIAKIIKLLLDKNKNNTYIAISSFVLLNAVILALQIKSFNISFVNIFTSILAFLWGYIFAKNVERE